jgi:four helix bundle protein
MPSEEKYALCQQMNRAAVSIPSNIAEGYSRFSTKEKMHFMNMAYGSLMELTCQYEIAKDLNYITQEQLNQYINKAKNLAVKISNFRKAIAKQ